MIQLILKLLGLTGDIGTVNKVAGGINILTLAPLGYFLWTHKLDTISFSYEQLFFFALIIYGYIEMNRRAT